MKDVPAFPLSLALFDAVPVALFFATTLIISLKIKSPLFMTGGIVTFAAGLCQVIWKLLIATSGKNVWLLHSQMKFVMPLGFLLMALALLLARKTISWKSLLLSLVNFPQLAFVILALLCCATMIVLSFTLGIKDVKSQWIEECVNVLFQGSVLVCAIIMAL